MTTVESHDVIVIGAGPAGQKAAIQAAKAGRSVALVEREARPGGACVLRGTIPSKTLHETASSLLRVARGETGLVRRGSGLGLPLSAMMARVDSVIDAHQRYMTDQVLRNGIELIHGRARFVAAHRVEVEAPAGGRRLVEAPVVVIATGSRPRDPDDVPVDHENIYDSDSILSLSWLPSSLTVLGGGVIASEYASIFAALGVEVIQIDRYPLPLGFMARPLVERFMAAFEEHGGRFVGPAEIAGVSFDGVAKVRTELRDGRVFETEKMLFALGRVANLDGLNVRAAGLEINARGLLDVDGNGQTLVPGVYAVGDVAGPPGLAASAMEQGRRAVRHALGLPESGLGELVPTGIYAIPEIAAVGLGSEAAAKAGREVVIGSAEFRELARAQICGNVGGLLRLVVDAADARILGVEIVGEGATEILHLGQAAVLGGWEVGMLVENVFNFPTMAEAYRVAALDVLARLPSPIGA
ncbi:MAG: Si-specific NAD(P)(+) transhydrogenase [Planctomycetes bacterium]|nr:Si-specific NAD(P)(+) transhydrogenase [Planctomycetota bacterium]